MVFGKWHAILLDTSNGAFPIVQVMVPARDACASFYICWIVVVATVRCMFEVVGPCLFHENYVMYEIKSLHTCWNLCIIVFLSKVVTQNKLCKKCVQELCDATPQFVFAYRSFQNRLLKFDKSACWSDTPRKRMWRVMNSEGSFSSRQSRDDLCAWQKHAPLPSAA